MFRLKVEKNRLNVLEYETVTSGSVNVYRVRFEFSTDWDGLDRTVVFRAGSERRSVLLGESGKCTLPWEVLAHYHPMSHLMVGVCGTRGGETVLPTMWADLGKIQEGVTTGENAQPPTPDLWRQELDRKGDTLDYDGLNLSLMSGDKPLSTVQVAGGGGESGGADYQFGHGLKVAGNTVSIDTVDDFKGDNTLPMTAAGVQTTVGNIEALLGTI